MSPQRERAANPRVKHIHLPSVHARAEDGLGYDYEEDFFVQGSGRQRFGHQVIRLSLVERGVITLVRETRDWLDAEDLARLEPFLPLLMDERHQEAREFMKECAGREFERQMRIAAGEERACAGCGCSESRSCRRQCVWATESLCSRCI